MRETKSKYQTGKSKINHKLQMKLNINGTDLCQNVCRISYDNLFHRKSAYDNLREYPGCCIKYTQF